MSIKYVTIDFTIDIQKLARDVRAHANGVIEDEDIPVWTVGQYSEDWLGVSTSYVSSLENYAKYKYGHDELLIGMKRFLLLCNKCNLDPRNYFVLEI